MEPIKQLHNFISAIHQLNNNEWEVFSGIVVDGFMDQQQQLLDLLEAAKQKNIGAIRTPISISRFIKLKVGDTFRFLIAHEQRHFLQIKNTIVEITGKFQSARQAIQQSPVFSRD